MVNGRLIYHSTSIWVSSTTQESVFSVWTCEFISHVNPATEPVVGITIAYSLFSPLLFLYSYVCMGRPGMRVSKRKYKHGRIGFQHKVKKDDSISWFKQRFDGIVGRGVSRKKLTGPMPRRCISSMGLTDVDTRDICYIVNHSERMR